MQAEKARKQRLHPLPGILEGLVAPHPDLPGLLGGGGGGGEGRAAGFPVEASITAAQAEAPAQAASSRWALGAAHLAGQAGGRRQTLPGQQASRQRPGLPPPQPSRSPNQLLIKGPEPSRPPETDCGLQ